MSPPAPENSPRSQRQPAGDATIFDHENAFAQAIAAGNATLDQSRHVGTWVDLAE